MKQVIEDPVTKQKFERPLTDDEISQIMDARFGPDKELQKVSIEAEQKIRELESQIEEYQKQIEEAAEKVEEFDKTYMPGVRATVLHNREEYNRTEQCTPHYLIGCKISKAEQPKYEDDDPQVVEWASKNAPETLKGPRVAKSKLNRILKKLPPKERPPGVEWKVPPASFPITRLR